MKKGERIFLILLISAFMVFLSIGLTSAIKCDIRTRATCDGTHAPFQNIVMGLSASTNAHGQVWNASSYSGVNAYDYVVCCDSGTGQASDHICNVNDKIIGLSAITNAHAEGTSGTSYTTNVCYNNLQCINTTTGCFITYPLNIFNLSSPTDAHIGTGAGYNTAICCKSANLAGAFCHLTNATWQYPSSIENGQVAMIVSGDSNCGISTAINFTIYKSLGVFGGTYFTSIVGNFNNITWIAKLFGTDTSDTYYFIARAIASGSTFDSGAGTGNKLLSVSQQPPEFCNSISLCSGYKDAQNCSSDATLCNPPRATIDPSCNPQQSNTCTCVWTGTACSLSTSWTQATVTTPNCFTLCYNSTLQKYYNYPGNLCPSGSEITPTGICDSHVGCYSPDCNNGAQASCETGATCSNGACSSGQTCQNVTGCDSGYTLCYNKSAGLSFCYPGNICRPGESPASTGTCGPGAGCSSTDCLAGGPTMTDSCLSGSYCQNGACYNPLAVEGKCIFHETTINDCSTSGQLEYSWTVDWTGTGAAPSYCTGGTKVAPCAAQIQLPFFGAFQIVLSIVIIILLYLLIVYRKKIFGKKNHSKKRK